MKRSGYILIQVVLIVAIIVFALLIYRSIMRPQKFTQIYDGRKTEVVNKLKTIREMQAYYKNEKGSYAKTFDQLRDFWTNGTMTVVKKEGNVPDTLTEAEALKLHIISRDTILVKASEEISKAKPELFANFDLNTFDIIPFSKGEKFTIDADTINRSGIKVYVYEVSAKREQYLKDMDDDPRVRDAFMGSILYSGLREQFLGPNFDYRDNVTDIILGSLTEPTTDGNWE